MMESFATTLAEWTPFFSAVAGISATLVGLCFVALAFNPMSMWDEGPVGLRVWSGQTFHRFLMVLTISLIALILDDSRWTLVIALGIIGGQGLGRLVLDLRRSRSDPDPQWSSLSSLTRFGSPTIAYGLCLWVA